MNQSQEKTKFIAAVNLLLFQDDKILLLRRYNTGFEDGNYGVPAGHIEENESILGAMSRETKEETDLTIHPEDLQVVHVMHRKTSNGDSFNFFLIAKKWMGTPTIMEPNKCDELNWCELDKLPKNMIPYIKKGLEAYLEKQIFSEEDTYATFTQTTQ